MRLKLKYPTILLIGLAVFLSAVTPVLVHAQSNVETFGQNRIQYRKFDWKYFDTKHFRIYHYDRAGRQLGRYVAEEAEDDIKTIEKKIGGQFPQRFNIVLYNSYDEYRQTNIGLKDESQLQENSLAGSVDLVGDKLVVYFTGEHADLKHQIRAGMSRVVMQRLVFGENFKKVVKNALLLNLPAWVTDGYISYIVDGWDTKANSEWKRILDARPGANFHDLSEQYPEIAGKAFWKFISEQYGNAMVKNLLYEIEQKTSINKGMKDKQALGLKVTKAYDSCIHFYKETYAKDLVNQEWPDSTKGITALKVPTDNTVVRNIKVSPRGSDVAYVTWKDGEYAVNLQRSGKGQDRAVILQGGQKDLTEQTDPDYPLMAWSTTGYKLAILFKKGKQTRIRIYNSLKGKIENYIIPANRFDRALGLTFMEEDDKLIISAIKKSQTDLFVFTIKGSKMTNITNDAWDDVDPYYIAGGSRKGILFLSNRPKPNLDVPIGVNELPTGPMNVFFYDTKTKRSELLQCSDVKTGHISQPIQYGFDNFAYLYDANGIQNKYVVMFARDVRNHDSAYAVPVTNYPTSIISHQYNIASNEVADVVQEKDKYNIYFHELMMPGVNVDAKKLTPTILSQTKPDTQARSANVRLKYSNIETEEVKPTEIKGGTAFQSEFTDTTTQFTPAPKRRNNIHNADKEAAATDSSTLPIINDSAYVKMKPAGYRASFKPDFFAVRLDNSVLFTEYQPYAGGQYTNPSLSALITLSLNELMEDHKFTGGFQLPINLDGTAYFLQYQNFKHRLDWGLLYLRTSVKEQLPVAYLDNNNNVILEKYQLFKNVTNMVQADFSYPFDRDRSLRFHTAFRQDHLVQKASDTLSLTYEIPNTNAYWSVSRLEYVFDNTISPTINIRNGFRYKFYAEEMYELNNSNASCYNIGLDFRSYQKIYKNVIFATRIAYAHSDGSSEVLYSLGGVDNWESPQQASNQPRGDSYGFQALATSLRGYDQGARLGNNYAVMSNELRLPVLTTFLKRPIQSAILKNLQFVAFADVGDAWYGFAPNAENTVATYNYPTAFSQSSGLNNVYLNLTVPKSGGVGLGYGGGLRTTLLGYFLRLDCAWNIEGAKKPIVYFALGTDF